MAAQRIFASLLVLTLFGFASQPAHAQSSCSADSDCVKGWTCQVSGGSTCTSAACAPGEKCEQQPSDCTNVEFKSCQPGACRADSDCADGMVCYTHTETDCPPTACASGQECAAASCAPRTESACVPRYVLPCSNESDCGSGFRCESAGEQCTCSGSAGAPDDARDGGAPSPPPEENCTCEPSKELRCRAVAVTCVEDRDCLANWSCAAVAATADCGSAPAPAPSPGEPAQDGGTRAPDCRPSTQIKQCVPPYYALIQGAQGVARDSAASPTLGIGEASSDTSGAPPKAGSSTDARSSSAGCSVGHGSRTGSAVAWLAALGLFGAFRRRRPR